MKKLLILPLFLILTMTTLAVWFYLNIQPVSSSKEFKDFLIAKGSSANAIGNNLQNAGLIRSALVFKIYTQFTGISKSIGTGEFKISPSYNLFQVVDTLTK